MKIIDSEEVRGFIEGTDYFGDGGEAALDGQMLEEVAQVADGFLAEQLAGNEWFYSMVAACISDALTCRG